MLVGGMPVTDFSPTEAARVHAAVADAIADGSIRSCHDSSDGGWAVAAAEMAIAGDRGASIVTTESDHAPFEELCAAYVVETAEAGTLRERLEQQGVSAALIGGVREDRALVVDDQVVPIDELRTIWAT